MRRYVFKDGEFDFYTALFPNMNRLTFRVKKGRSYHERAKEKGIVGYDNIFHATPSEVELWELLHFDYPILETKVY